MTDLTLTGAKGTLTATRWDAAEPTFVAVLLHGYAEHAGRYAHVAAALNEAGGTVIAPDHYGHGRSEGTHGSIEDIGTLVTDVEQAFAAARELDLPVVLIGHSMGGLIAIRYVQTHDEPLAALVLSGPFLGNPELEGLAGLDPMPDVPLDPAALSRDPAVGEAYVADELVYSGPIRRETLEAMIAAMGQAKEGRGFGDLPVLHIHGEADPLALEPVATEIIQSLKGPNTQSKVYPGAVHEIFNETNQDEVIGDTIAFVQQHV